MQQKFKVFTWKTNGNKLSVKLPYVPYVPHGEVEINICNIPKKCYYSSI